MPKHSRNKNNNGGKKSKTQRTRSRSGSRRSPAAEGGGRRRTSPPGGGRAPRGSQLAALAMGSPMPHHAGFGYRDTDRPAANPFIMPQPHTPFHLPGAAAHVPRGSQLAALAQGSPMPHHAGWGYRLTNVAPSHVQGGPPQTPFGLLPRPPRTRSRSRSASRNRKP
jgi:hypothetical protein